MKNQVQGGVKEPLFFYARDFDGNGIVDPVLSYYIHDTAYPVYSRDDLMDHLPYLKKRFLEYHDYAHASMADVFGDKLQQAKTYKADQLATVYLHNAGNRGFELRPLPGDAQLSPIYAICAGAL